MLPNCPEYVVAFFGTMRIGATATQVNPVYVGRELTHIFENSGTETVIVNSMMYEKAKAVQENTPLKRIICVGEPDGGLKDGDVPFDVFLQSATGGMPEVEIGPQEDLSSIQYTGGTTGISKGAMLTHANLLGGVKQTMDLLIEDPAAFPENGKVIAVAPFFHIFGMTMVLLFGLRMGWNLLTVPRFQPDVVMGMIGRRARHASWRGDALRRPTQLSGHGELWPGQGTSLYLRRRKRPARVAPLLRAAYGACDLGGLRPLRRRTRDVQHIPPGVGRGEHRGADSRY